MVVIVLEDNLWQIGRRETWSLKDFRTIPISYMRAIAYDLPQIISVYQLRQPPFAGTSPEFFKP